MSTYNDEAVDQWIAKYKPKKNPFNPNASWEGTLFETYGEEVKHVLDYLDHLGNHHVWTYLETETGTAISAGWSFVNRIGYFITEVPWENLDVFIEDETYSEEDYE